MFCGKALCPKKFCPKFFCPELRFLKLTPEGAVGVLAARVAARAADGGGRGVAVALVRVDTLVEHQVKDEAIGTTAPWQFII
jgi:hypothetical protein